MLPNVAVAEQVRRKNKTKTLYNLMTVNSNLESFQNYKPIQTVFCGNRRSRF